MRKTVMTAALAVAALGLAGCYESTDVTIHGKESSYKGSSDPLLAQQTSARVETLKKRFDLVQIDR